MLEFIKGLKKTMLITGLLCLALGLIVLIRPDYVQSLLPRLLGLLLVLFGLTELVAVFVKPGRFVAVSRMVPGILALAVGLVFLFTPKEVQGLLWMFVGLTVLVDAVYKFQYAFEAKAAKVKTWWAVLLLALATLLLSVGLIVANARAIEILVTLAGILILANGLFDVAVSVYFGVFTKKVEAAALAAPDAALVPKK